LTAINIEKHFKVKQQGASQGRSFSKDFFQCNRIKYRQWGGGWRGKEREAFPVHAGHESKDSKWWPHLLVVYWRAGRAQVVKDNGAGWLRWLTKQGGVTLPNYTQSHSSHRAHRWALEL
jgi:hypothetical protein